MIRRVLLKLVGGERRAHAREYRRKLVLKTDRGKFETLDWSLGGCRIGPIEPRPKVGDEFSGVITGIGLANRGEFLAEVVRLGKNGEIGLRWLEMDPHTFMSLSGLKAKSRRSNG